MCTVEKRGNLFILTLTGDDDHRLSPTLIAAILKSLSQIKSQATPRSVLITASHGRFFSNGFDLRWANAAGSVSAAADRLRHMVQILPTPPALYAEIRKSLYPEISRLLGSPEKNHIDFQALKIGKLNASGELCKRTLNGAVFSLKIFNPFLIGHLENTLVRMKRR